MTNEIILQAMSTNELKEMIRELVRSEFSAMSEEIQRVIGEDDLISSGSACRVLGVSAKILKYHIDEGHFTVYYHLKERRFSRGELLEYRNRHRVNKKRV